MAKQIRLDKFLCDAGFGTRKEIKEHLKKQAVTVNGTTVTKPEYKVHPEEDVICFQGEAVSFSEFAYYMFHKPAGCVTATRDRDCRTVMDYFHDVKRKDLFPVGRLDKDTEGFLLITNDGALAHNLLSPKKHVEKTYFARTEGQVKEEHIALFAEGLDIGDEKPTLPAKLEILSSGETSEILLTITEGRFHQVKRMLEAVGCRVTYLKRLSMGGLSLDEALAPGEYRRLSAEEMKRLQRRPSQDSCSAG